MSRVYVVQRPCYFDRKTHQWVEKYDLSPAEAHGELVVMLPPGNIYRDRLLSATALMAHCLRNFTEEDHLLTAGDPVAISTAAMLASRRTGGRVSLLKFDKRSGKYDPFLVRLPNEG